MKKEKNFWNGVGMFTLYLFFNSILHFSKIKGFFEGIAYYIYRVEFFEIFHIFVSWREINVC